MQPSGPYIFQNELGRDNGGDQTSKRVFIFGWIQKRTKKITAVKRTADDLRDPLKSSKLGRKLPPQEYFFAPLRALKQR